MDQHILFDTCVLIAGVRHPKDLETITTYLTEHAYRPAIDETIQLEFLRSANSMSSYEKLQNFLQNLFADDVFVINVDKNIFRDARRISNLYYHKNIKKKPEIADCLIAAQLKKYAHNLSILTFNNTDFPTALFERIHTGMIDLNEEPTSWSIYRFSVEKYNARLESFLKSNHSSSN